jgi:hypothetical protein
MPVYKIGRRGVLKGLSALVPLSMGLGARPVLAGTGPKRAIFFFIPDGCVPELWHPTGSEFSFTLSPMTKPLEEVRKDCVFINGLTMYEGGGSHEGGVAKVLTGNGPLSLDVFLAQEIGKNSRFSSIYLGVHGTHEGNTFFSYLPGNKARTPEDNPIAAFKSLFGTPGSAPATGGGTSAPAAFNGRKSVLDVTRGELSSLAGRLSTGEKAKLDLHLDALREIEQRLGAASAASAPSAAPAAGGACAPASFNKEGFQVPEGFNGYPAIFNREENFETVGKLQMDLAVQALACDVTRVASIQWSHPVSPTRMEFTGSTQRHHDASHYGNPDSPTAQNFVLLQSYYTGRLKYLINELRKRPDGDGTLLDNTIIFLFSELGDSNIHDHNNMPFIVAGGAGGALSGGRYLNLPKEAHSKLLVSIANAMGVPINSFGYTGKGLGPLPGLLKA